MPRGDAGLAGEGLPVAGLALADHANAVAVAGEVAVVRHGCEGLVVVVVVVRGKSL